MEVIKMQAAGSEGTYIVTVLIDGGLVTGAFATGPAPKKIENICRYFRKQMVKVKNGAVNAILRTEMEKCGKFIGEFQ